VTASTKALVPPVAKVPLRRRSASLGSIPSYCKLVYWEGVPYYYADDIYYEWNGSVGAYEQVQPPAALAENAQAPVLNRSADLFMPVPGRCAPCDRAPGGTLDPKGSSRAEVYFRRRRTATRSRVHHPSVHPSECLQVQPLRYRRPIDRK